MLADTRVVTPIQARIKDGLNKVRRRVDRKASAEDGPLQQIPQPYPHPAKKGQSGELVEVDRYV